MVCLENQTKFLKRVSLFSPTALESFANNLEEKEFLRVFPLIKKHLPSIEQVFLNKFLDSPDPNLFENCNIEISTLPEKLNKASLHHLRILLTLSKGALIPELLNKYIQNELNHYKKNFVVEKFPELGNLLYREKTQQELYECLEYTLSLDNLKTISYLLKDSVSKSKVNLFAVKNSLLEFLAPPCLADSSIPLEFFYLLKEMTNQDLLLLKDFVFTKLLAINIQKAIGVLLTQQGVCCRDEVELCNLKLKVINLIPEELQVELLHSKEKAQCLKLLKPKFRKLLE